MAEDGLGEPGRLARLRETGLLDSEPEASFDRVTRLATRLLGVPVALVSLVDDRRQFFKSQVGLAEPWASERQTALTHSFCQHVVARGVPLVVHDAREDDLVAHNAAIDDLGVIAYAGEPLRVGGEVIGSFCAIDVQPRVWTDAELADLADLASFVAAEIELRLALREAATVHELYRGLARDVHDQVLQCLAAAKLALELDRHELLVEAIDAGISAAQTLSDVSLRLAEGPGAFRRPT